MRVLYSHSESEAEVDVEDEEEEEEEDGDVNDENGSTVTVEGLGGQVLKAWNKRRTKLEHEYAVAGWALSVLPEVRADALERITGEHRDMIESVVLRLHVPPCPNKNPKIRGMTDEEITDLFWEEYKLFTHKMGPYNKESRWNSPDVKAGRSHCWHEKYSLPYTVVLGFVGCRVTSKCLGIGAAERSWGDVKTIKSGNRSHISAASVEKRAILYTTARVNEARIQRKLMEKIDAEGPNTMFGDDDLK